MYKSSSIDVSITYFQESDEIISTNLTDFREQYFALRNESRKEKRMKRAEKKAKNRELWEQNYKENSHR